MTRQRLEWTVERVTRLEKMWLAKVDVVLIADELKTSRGAIYTKAHQLGLRRRERGAVRKAMCMLLP